uniref:Uncharacterized protein n=1 Tax=Populus trichocarpa TaxID=3694 RepID=A0A2K1YHT6_POPTR
MALKMLGKGSDSLTMSSEQAISAQRFCEDRTRNCLVWSSFPHGCGYLLINCNSWHHCESPFRWVEMD